MGPAGESFSALFLLVWSYPDRGMRDEALVKNIKDEALQNVSEMSCFILFHGYSSRRAKFNFDSGSSQYVPCRE